MPLVPEFERISVEFEASQGYIASSRPTKVT